MIERMLAVALGQTEGDPGEITVSLNIGEAAAVFFALSNFRKTTGSKPAEAVLKKMGEAIDEQIMSSYGGSE